MRFHLPQREKELFYRPGNWYPFSDVVILDWMHIMFPMAFYLVIRFIILLVLRMVKVNNIDHQCTRNL